MRMHGLPTRTGAELIDRLRERGRGAGHRHPHRRARARTPVRDADGAHRAASRSRRPTAARSASAATRSSSPATAMAATGAGARAHSGNGRRALFRPSRQSRATPCSGARRSARELGDLGGHQGHGSVAHAARHPDHLGDDHGGRHPGERARRSASRDEATAIPSRRPACCASRTASPGRSSTRASPRSRASSRIFGSRGGRAPCCRRDDWPTLAATAGLPPEALAATHGGGRGLETDRRRPIRFGRDFTASRPLAPPYNAVRVTGALFHTQGGLVVDDDRAGAARRRRALAQSVRRRRRRLRRLGQPRRGYLSGNGLLSAVALGEIAGAAAALLAQDNSKSQG